MYKEIKCSRGTIKVYDDGSIYSFNGRLLKGTIVAGYRMIKYSVCENTMIQSYVHRLVASLFLENPNNFTQVTHIDGNKLNNNVNNLKWCSRSKINKNNKLVCGFGITDIKIIDDECKLLLSYTRWNAMITRCYSIKSRKHYPTYIGCSVCDEWKYYSNFKEWFDVNYIDGYQLDKDILVNGNKVYSPETCCFIPSYLNALFNDSKKIRGICSIGVYFHKKLGKFHTQININGSRIYIGLYNTESEAHNAWLNAKREYARKLAINAYMNNEITEIIMNAIIKKAYELN